MTDSNEWGSWIEHDGSGCPVIGQYVQAEFRRIIKKAPSHYVIISPKVIEGIMRRNPANIHGDSWNWRRGNPVLRYRIRKPRGLTILERIAEQPEREKVTT